MKLNWFVEQWLTLLPKTQEFFSDLKQVIQALGLWSGVFIVAELILGLLPLALVMTLGSTIDATIGARGIGVMTSDIRQQLGIWAILLLTGFFAYVFVARFTGKADSVGSTLRNTLIFGSLLMFLLLGRQIFLALVYFLALITDNAFNNFPKVRVINLAVVVFAGMAFAQVLIRFTVFRAFTVGEGLSLAVAIAVFMMSFKLRVVHG